MLSAAEIRNVKFTKAMGGYKQEEVDVLLDRVEADYAQFDRSVKDRFLKQGNRKPQKLAEQYSERACKRAEACRSDS